MCFKCGHDYRFHFVDFVGIEIDTNNSPRHFVQYACNYPLCECECQRDVSADDYLFYKEHARRDRDKVEDNIRFYTKRDDTVLKFTNENTKLAIKLLLDVRKGLVSQHREYIRLAPLSTMFLEDIWKLDKALKFIGFTEFDTLEFTYQE